MPLKLLQGENIKALKTKPVVMPLEKWQDTEFFALAAQLAEDSFGRSYKMRKGWKGKIRGEKPRFIFGPNEVLVQVYPYEPDGPALAFIFCKRVQGKELYAPFATRLSPQGVQWARMTGRWPATIELPGKSWYDGTSNSQEVMA